MSDGTAAPQFCLPRGIYLVTCPIAARRPVPKEYACIAVVCTKKLPQRYNHMCRLAGLKSWEVLHDWTLVTTFTLHVLPLHVL
jgi:hypothetical protein